MSPRLLAVAALGAALAGATAASPPSPSPLAAPALPGHAHNDYQHEHPLHDALDLGYCSVEADVHLVSGELLVAHAPNETEPERTLRSLYLDPLRTMLAAGEAPCADGPLLLLVDIKGDALATYRELLGELASLTPYLTVRRSDGVHHSGVTVVLSGNRPWDLLLGPEADAITFLDGRIPDLADPSLPADRVPLISDSWARQFSWRGAGALPDEEAARLREIVATTHAQRRLLRFWAVPENPAVWHELLTAGVDFVSTDDLAGFARFARRTETPASP